MMTNTNYVNRSGPIAPLQNVRLFMELIEKLLNRAGHLPGLGVFYGFSGYGKTQSAIYGANRAGAYYIECGASWNVTSLVDNIYHELTGGRLKGTVAAKVREIIAILGSDTRPLIIDEADFLIKRAMIDIVREIADRSSVPIVLIGEEQIPGKLIAFERAHNRVLEWQPAEPCNLDDAKALAKLYVPLLDIDAALLKHVVDTTDGVTRRVCSNLERIREFAATKNLKTVTAADWGGQAFYTGTPKPRQRRHGRAAA
jgi:DNA transposition AAA+ family ATPase